MNPASGTVLIGNCLQTLPQLPPAHFHACVTSPPYLGLRSYGGTEAETDWPAVRYAPMPGVPEVEVPAGRVALGLEPDPGAYVGHLVAVFREVRRVLREDGILWLNLGDSYSGGQRGSYYPDPKMPERTSGRIRSDDSGNLLGVPWRVALALQADGWTLRSDVIMRKEIPIPESVTGWLWVRCRRKVAPAPAAEAGYGVAHAVPRRARQYSTEAGSQEYAKAKWEPCPGCNKCVTNGGFLLRRGSWRPTRSYEHAFLLAPSSSYFVDGARALEPTRGWRVTPVKGHKRSGQPRRLEEGEQRAVRNPRDIIDLPPRPSRLSHSAMMPPDFAAWCLRGGPRSTCAACGAPRVSADPGVVATCSCGAPDAPPRVLDPFMGAGTVAAVAAVRGWSWAGCELSQSYVDLMAARQEEVRRMLGGSHKKNQVPAHANQQGFQFP